MNKSDKIFVGVLAASAIFATGVVSAAAKVHAPTHGRTRIGMVMTGGVTNDGGGRLIMPTRNGGFVVKKIPPWQPKYGAVGANIDR